MAGGQPLARRGRQKVGLGGGRGAGWGLEVGIALGPLLLGQRQDAVGDRQVGVLGQPVLEVVVASANAARDQFLESQIADQALVVGRGAVAFGGVEVTLGGGAEGRGIDRGVLVRQGADLRLGRTPKRGGQGHSASAERQKPADQSDCLSPRRGSPDVAASPTQLH